MKKPGYCLQRIALLSVALIYQDIATADCNAKDNGTAVFEWKMNIKNSTDHDLAVSGSCTDYPILKKGETHVFSQSICSSTWSLVSCTLTDNTATNDSLTVSIDPCYTNGSITNAYPNQSPSHVQSYTCPFVSLSTSLTSYCAPNKYVSVIKYTVIGYFDIITNSPQYNLTWNNVSTTLVKGQIMANKLGQELLKLLSYDISKASYDPTQKKISIVLKNSQGNADPYSSSTSGADCENYNNTA